MATTWYAQNSSVNIDSANEWNDAADGSGSWLTWPCASDDTLRANGKTAISINVDFTAAQIDTLTSGGGFTCTTTRAITCNVVSGTTTCIAASVNSTTLTITGSITAGSGSATHGVSLSNSRALVVTGGGTITGGSSSGNGINHAGSGNLTITANIVGGSGNGSHGVVLVGSGVTVSITGNVTGGSGSNRSCFGIRNASASTCTVTGNVTGGSTNDNSGINNESTGVMTVIGNLINAANAQAMTGRLCVYTPASTNYEQWPTTGGGTVKLYPPSAMPDAKYVYDGINRGDGTTGTLHASTISAAAGSGSNLSAGILKDGEVVDDVTGTYTGGGGGAVVGPFEVGPFR